MFLERLSATGVGTNKYYESKGTFNKLASTASSALPNCTTYCLLRSYEFLNLDDRIKGIAIRNSYGWHNAKYWFKETGMPTGDVLREGSIAVFDGNCGHVAFIERKIDETHALITESNYDANKKLRNWKYWRKREVELIVGKATLSGVGKLLGYIYLPIEDVDIRTSRDKTKNQVEVSPGMLNVRTTPGGDLYRPGCYCPAGIYNVLDMTIKDDTTWYKIDEDCWIAQVEEVEYLPIWEAEPEPEPTVEKKLNIKITNLRMREEPTTKSTNKGYAEKGEHVYTETAEADGYTWYKIENGYWIAGIEGDVELIEEIIPEPEPTPEPETPTWVQPTSVDENTEVDQIYLNCKVRIRYDSSTDAESMAVADKNTFYNVLDFEIKSDYTWYQIGEHAWIAGVEEVEYRPKIVWEAPIPVSPDLNKNQLIVGDVTLNIRLQPNTPAKKQGTCRKNSTYDVLAIKEQEDYTWYQLGINSWVAGVDEVDYIPAGVPKDFNAIIEDANELKSNLDIAIKAVENKKCQSYYKELQDKTNDLNDLIKKNFNYIDYDYEDDKEYNEIDLLYTTDIHGYWKGYQESTRVQTNFSINDLNTLKNNLKKQGIPSLLVNSGDIIHGSDTANVNYGEDVVNAFNNLDMFASVFGNHEFRYNDEGPWFQTRMKALESMTACNLLYKDTGKLVFKPYRLARFGSKIIGVIGVGFPGFDGGRGNTDEYTILDGLDCCKQIQKYINELRELGANYIFCAVHLGDGTDARAGNNISVPIIANNTEGLDAILPGHSHAMTAQHTEINSKGNPVIVLAQPRCDLMYISRVRIKKDGITSELLDTI